MANVIASLTMSVDGFIALPDDSVGHLFDWYESGEVALAWPGMGMVSHVTPASAGYLRDTIEGTGAIVVGRRVYDYTSGWGGNHPLGVPLFLVTHRPPQSWPTPDAPFTAVPEGVAAAIGQAKAIAGDKAVALAGPSISSERRGPSSRPPHLPIDPGQAPTSIPWPFPPRPTSISPGAAAPDRRGCSWPERAASITRIRRARSRTRFTAARSVARSGTRSCARGLWPFRAWSRCIVAI